MASTKTNHYDDNWFDMFDAYHRFSTKGNNAPLLDTAPCGETLAAILDKAVSEAVSEATSQRRPMLVVYASGATASDTSVVQATNHPALNNSMLSYILGPILAADEEASAHMLGYLSGVVPQMVSATEAYINETRSFH